MKCCKFCGWFYPRGECPNLACGGKTQHMAPVHAPIVEAAAPGPVVPDKFKCPECGGDPAGTVELIPGVAGIMFDEAGVPSYDGETKMDWDGSTTERNKAGEILFACAKCGEEYAVPGVIKIG